MAVTVTGLRERVRRLHGLEELLPALVGLPRSYLVGGAVRDMLRGARPADLDIAVEGHAPSAARAAGARLDREVREHGRFGTAIMRGEPDVNFAMTRRETYSAPGALPVVQEAPLSEDLARRDFGVNAMAIGLTGDDLGHLYDPHGGVSDLEAGAVRVLHDQSFVDDPTRLLRALRYEARLGFAMEPDTERLALAAIEGGALGTVSGVRVGDQLVGRAEPRPGARRGLLAEQRVARAVARMHGLGLDRALHPCLEADPELVASAALGAQTIGSDRALAALAALCSVAPQELDLWLADLGLPAPQRDAVARAARVGPRLATELRVRAHAPSELAALLRGEPPEALALALALQAPPADVLRWVGELREVRLEITGDDLTAAGVPEGPALGRALDETLARKLDGLVDGRDEELEHALRLAEEGP
jgi:tRNA nucleotidyltransferase (CCA-adding enzyme)